MRRQATDHERSAKLQLIYRHRWVDLTLSVIAVSFPKPSPQCRRKTRYLFRHPFTRVNCQYFCQRRKPGVFRHYRRGHSGKKNTAPGVRPAVRRPVVRTAVSPRLDHRRCWMTHWRPSWDGPVAHGARSPGHGGHRPGAGAAGLRSAPLGGRRPVAGIESWAEVVNPSPTWPGSFFSGIAVDSPRWCPVRTGKAGGLPAWLLSVQRTAGLVPAVLCDVGTYSGADCCLLTKAVSAPRSFPRTRLWLRLSC